MTPNLMLSDKTRNEIINQIKHDKVDLVHQLMLCDITITSDGFYLQRDDGDIGYNRFLGKPELNDITLGRMYKEVNTLTKSARNEVMMILGKKYPDVWKALVNYQQAHSKIDIDGYFG